MQNLQINGYFKVPDWVPSFPRPTKGLGGLWKECFSLGKERDRYVTRKCRRSLGWTSPPSPPKTWASFSPQHTAKLHKWSQCPRTSILPREWVRAEITRKMGPPVRTKWVHPYMQLSPALWDLLAPATGIPFPQKLSWGMPQARQIQ